MSTEVQKVLFFSSFNEKELSDYAKGFLEAAIDGEGSIFLTTYHRSKYTGRIYYNPGCQTGNKSKEWLELMREVAGDHGNISGGKIEFYNYQMSWKGMRRILPQLGLVIKERQRVLILEALDILAELRSYKNTEHFSFRDEGEYRLAEIASEISELNNK